MSFPEKRRVKEYNLHQTRTARDAEGTALRKGTKRVREEHRYEGSRMGINKYLSITILNLNGLNTPIKRHRVGEWIRKYDPHIWYLQDTHLRTKDLHRLKVMDWKKNIPSKHEEKKARVQLQGWYNICKLIIIILHINKRKWEKPHDHINRCRKSI